MSDLDKAKEKKNHPKEFTPLNDFVFLFNRGLELKRVIWGEGVVGIHETGRGQSEM